MKLAKFLTLLLILFCLKTGVGQEEKPVQAPSEPGFRLGENITGNAVNSVNMFTGEVVFPLNIVSLPGINGLHPTVNISYNSSGVTEQCREWNNETSTGVLGLGWKIEDLKIIADHKQTGNREDDEYYLIEGGTSNRLIYLNGTSTQYYTTEAKNNWVITYNEGDEKWEINKEDGSVLTFGGINIGASSILWAVKWGNWIGSSANSSGQSRMAYGWKLSSISNRTNDIVTFTYKTVEQFVGSSSGKRHTEASYLSEIIGALGEKINFRYQDKNPQEYSEPHTEKAEPDAYQENYEKLYLSQIDIFNEFDLRLSSVEFSYEYLGVGQLMKRILTGISYDNANGESMPGLKFEYELTGVAAGKMKSMQNSTGATIQYGYSETPVSPGYSLREKIINAPSGYAEPEIFWGADYAFVTWRQLSNGTHVDTKQNVKAYVYTWEGYWKEQYLGTYSNVESEYGFRKKFHVKLGKDQFAVAAWTGNSEYYKVNLYHKDKLSGEWLNDSYQEYTTTGEPILLMGDRFIALHTASDGDVFTYMWNGKDWTRKVINQSGNEWEATASTNWILSHQKGGTDYLRLHHLTTDNEWKTEVISNPFNSDHDHRSYWHATPSFALAMAAENPEYIYSWNENLNSFTRHDVIGEFRDNSEVFTEENGIFNIYDIADRCLNLAYTGTGFKSIKLPTDWTKPYTFGADFLLYVSDSRSSPLEYNLYKYDPNSLKWFKKQTYALPAQDGLFINSRSVTKAGVNSFSILNRFYFEDPSGFWSYNNTLSESSGIKIFPSSFRYYNRSVIYNIGDTNNNYLGFRVKHIKNGSIGENISTVYSDKYEVRNTLRPGGNQTIKLLGNEMFATTSFAFSSKFQDATSLKIYKIISDKIKQAQEFYPVTKIITDTGFQQFSTSFSYEPSSAKANHSGNGAQYNKVTMIPGTDNPAAKPHGYSETYFFNGLSSSQSSLAFPVRSGNADSYRKVLTGTAYATISYDYNSNEVARSEISYKGFADSGYDRNGLRKHISYYVRPVNSYTIVDKVESEVDFSYNNLGQLTTRSTFNYNSKGEKDVIKEYYKYWWEAYDPTRNGVFLGPVIQRKKSVNSTYTSVSATTWQNYKRNNLNVSLPARTYYWKGEGNPEFTAWTGSPSQEVWQAASEVVERDAYFNISVSKDLDGINSTNIYDQNNLLIGNVYNASSEEVLLLDFEDHDLANTSGSWLTTPNWGFENGTLKCSSLTGSGNLYTNKIISANENHIAEFDYKLLEGSGYISYHFGKTSSSHIPSGSGYSVRVSQTEVSVYYLSNLLESSPLPNDAKWHHLTVLKGGKIKVFIDGDEIIETLASAPFGNYIGIYTISCATYIDNFRLYPEDGFMTSTSYDRNYKYVIAQTDAQGFTSKTLYSSAGNKVASIGINNTPVNTSSGYSSYRDNGQYDRNNPSIIHSTTIRDKGGFYEDFQTDNPYWVFKEFNNGTTASYSFKDGALSVISNGGATNSTADVYYIDLGYELKGLVGVEFDFHTIIGGNNNGLGLALGGDSWDTRNGGAENAVWMGLYGPDRLRAYNSSTGWKDVKSNLKPLTTYRVKVLVDLASQTADYYVDGKLYMDNYPLRYNSSGIQKIAFYHYGYGSASEHTIDNLVVYSGPMQSSTFVDGAGMVLQHQAKETDSHVIVTEYLYDGLGRNNAETKPTRVTGDLIYRADFVTDFNGISMHGEVTDLNSDGYYPFYATKYEASPLGRMLEQSQPGAIYRLNLGKNGRVEYLSNADVDMGEEYPVGKYKVVKTSSPDGGESYTMMDIAGNVIKEKAGPVIGKKPELEYTTKKVEANESFSLYCRYDGQITYNYYQGKGSALKIGTVEGGSDIVYTSVNKSGSFEGVKGQWYYVTVVTERPDPTPQYYDFDCETPIVYNSQYCFNSNNCRIKCPIITPAYYDYDCRTIIPYNEDYCFDSNNCRITCGVQPIAARTQPLSLISTVVINYPEREVWVDGHEIYATTSYEYDTYGNLIKIYPPNYHNFPGGAIYRGDYIQTMEYDFFGRIKKSTDPDKGITRYIYDEQTGRLRFSQDSNGFANGTINYSNYDIFGRPIQGGYFNASWDESNLQSLANSGQSPTAKVERVSNTYESKLNDDVYHRGQLIFSGVSNDEDYNDEILEYYRYNKYGISAKGINVPEYKNETTWIKYEADNLGNTITEEIPGLGKIAYTYDQLNRLSKIGEDSNDDLYAKYSYNLNGYLAQEILNDNSYVRDFDYDSPGRLHSISDPNFQETLGYTSGGYSGAGYYAGLIAKAAFNYKGISAFAGTPANYSYSFQYDKLGRLEIGDNSANNAWDIGVGESTKYDPNGNIQKLRKGSTTNQYTYKDGSNKVIRVVGSTDQFSYDNKGNIISSATKGITNIQYDPYLNRPTNISYETGMTKLWYGADGERVMKTNIPSDGGDTHYTLYVRGSNEYPVIEKERIDAGDWHTRYYIYGLTGLVATKTITAYEQASFDASVATFEVEKRETENAEFGDTYRSSPIVNAKLFNSTDGESSSYAIKLTGEAGKQVGISKSVSMYEGDTLRLKVSAKYIKPESKNKFVPAVLAAELLTSMGLPSTAEGNPLYHVFNNALSTGAAGLSAYNDGVPKAFLNYIYFDKDFNLISQGFKQISEEAYEDGTNRSHEELTLEMVAPREGFVVAYVSNEGNEYSEVFFDDFTVEQAAVPQVKFYSKDHQGSIRVVVNDNGTVDARYDYDAIGAISRQSEGFISNNYRYTGQEYDAELDLHNYRVRQYDSELGRFYAGDPLMQFSSPYVGLGNSAINGVDPDGQWFGADDIVAAAIGGIINLSVNAYQGNLSGGSVWDVIGKGAAAFGAGAAAGTLSLYGPGGWAAGGAIIGGTNAWLGGAAGWEIAGGAGMGAVTGLAGGAIGAGLSPAIGNLTSGMASPVLRGAVGGLAGGAVTGGILGGANAGLTGGNFWQGVVNGTWTGALTGFVAGGASAGVIAKARGYNPFTGKNKNYTPPLVKKIGLDDALSGSEWWVQGSDRSRLNTIKPGRFARQGVASTEKVIPKNSVIRDQVNKIGQKHGCHTCGIKTDNGIYIPDHQAPVKINVELKFTIYPHCPACSRMQGGQVNQYIRNNGN